MARPSQVPPGGDWLVWLILAGRGFGKTRTGAEWVRTEISHDRRGRVALVGRTAADVRDTMIEGPAGILACCAHGFRPDYEPSKRRLTWPNGAVCIAYSAEEADTLRGPEHDGAWCDEVAAWDDARRGDVEGAAWANLMLGLRAGSDPRCVVTTTPKPVLLLIGTPDRPGLVRRPSTVVTRGSTYDNLGNLAPSFREQILSTYEGTRIGRQELLGELLEDVEGALWRQSDIDDQRRGKHPDLWRVVVGVDPSGGSSASNDEQGIIVAGVDAGGHGYVLGDYSCRLSPDGWGKRAVDAYVDHHADRVLWEANFGGEMVEKVIEAAARDAGEHVTLKRVRASRGKRVRAEPVAALYEQGKVHHVGTFGDLEAQMCGWTAESRESPDRVDALVWALTELMVDGRRSPARSHGGQVRSVQLPTRTLASGGRR